MTYYRIYWLINAQWSILSDKIDKALAIDLARTLKDMGIEVYVTEVTELENRIAIP